MFSSSSPPLVLGLPSPVKPRYELRQREEEGKAPRRGTRERESPASRDNPGKKAGRKRQSPWQEGGKGESTRQRGATLAAHVATRRGASVPQGVSGRVRVL